MYNNTRISLTITYTQILLIIISSNKLLTRYYKGKKYYTNLLYTKIVKQCVKNKQYINLNYINIIAYINFLIPLFILVKNITFTFIVRLININVVIFNQDALFNLFILNIKANINIVELVLKPLNKNFTALFNVIYKLTNKYYNKDVFKVITIFNFIFFTLFKELRTTINKLSSK